MKQDNIYREWFKPHGKTAAQFAADYNISVDRLFQLIREYEVRIRLGEKLWSPLSAAFSAGTPSRSSGFNAGPMENKELPLPVASASVPVIRE